MLDDDDKALVKRLYDFHRAKGRGTRLIANQISFNHCLPLSAVYDMVLELKKEENNA